MASITDQTRWRRVLNHVAADLKAVIDIAAGQSVEVTQNTATDLKALVTLAGLQGIIPNPIGATRVTKFKDANGVAASIIYTVPDDKRLFISSAWTSSRESVAAAATCFLYVRDAGDVEVYRLFQHLYDVAGHQGNTLRYFPALEFPEKHDVVIESAHANVDARGGFTGWLEAV